MGIPRRSLIPRGRIPRQTLLYSRHGQVAAENVLPVAEFSSAAGADSLTFDFTDESTDSDGTIVSWLWDFGDGSGTSTDQHPSYTYAVQGSKTVRLTVTDNRGGEHFVEHDVLPLPIMPDIDTVGAEVASVLGAALSVPVPGTYQNNDLVYLFCECLQTETLSVAGYTQIGDSPQTAAATKLQIFRKRLSGIGTPGSGEANAAVTGHTNHAICVPVLVRNAQATGDPENVTAGNTGASSTTVTIPGDTTDQPNCLVIAACAAGTDTLTDQFGSWANASLANFGEIADAFTTDGGGGGVGVAAGELATAGAYDPTTATLAGASSQGRISFAVMGKGTS